MNTPPDSLQIFLRAPRLPAIIISKEQLFASSDMGSLATGVLKAVPHKTMSFHVHVIDSSGEEFWFIPEQRTLAPGFVFRKWTKMRIIGLFNSSSNAMRLGIQYLAKSLSNKSLAQVISDVIALLERSEESGAQ
jgi:hypothetical protein